MKFTVEGLNQEQLVKWHLDATDAVIVRWFADFFLGDGMKKIESGGKQFGWVKYAQAIRELPCLGIKTRRALSTRFGKYVKCGLMDVFIKKDNTGTWSCYRLVPEKWDLLNRWVAEEVNFLCAEEPDFPCAEEANFLPAEEVKQHPKNSSINDSSINKNKNSPPSATPRERAVGKTAARKTPMAEKKTTPPEGYSDFVAELHRLHEKITGGKYIFTAADGQLVKRILALGKDEALSRLKRYYLEDHWFTKEGRSLKGFAAHVNDLAGGNGKHGKAESQRLIELAAKTQARFREVVNG
jgi:hypothetical protein